MDIKKILVQLQRRGVYRVAAIYSAAAWALLQVADVIFPIIGLADGSITVVLLIAVAGFPVSLVLAWVFDLTADGIVETPPEHTNEHHFPLSPTRFAELVMIVVLILLVGYLYLDRLIPASQTNVAQSVLPDYDLGADRASIAVMPFVNFSDASSMGYFGDGLAEEILNLLTKLKELRVSARTSSFYFKNKEVDIATIARHLGVRYVLEGSVRHANNRTRVTAQLIDTKDSFHIWSETYDRDSSNVFDLQDEIAQNVVKNLQLVLSTSSQEVLEQDLAVDPSAYDFYLRGRDYLRQPQNNSTLNNAEKMFNQAVELQPNYAEAYAGLCDTLLLQYLIDMDKTWFAAAEQACLRAQSLNSRGTTVHVALGNLYRGSGQYGLSEQEFNRAISLQPEAVDAYIGLAETFVANGKNALAEQTLVRAIELEPNYWSASVAMGRYLFRVGRVEESIPYFTRINDLLPESGVASNNLGAAYFLTGRFQDAASAWEDSLGRSPTVNVYTNLGSSYFFLGRFQAAAKMYQQALQLAPTHFEVWGSLGDAYYHWPEETQRAAAAYERALELAREHLKINPSDAVTQALTAHYLARIGEKAQALEIIGRLQQVAQTDMYVYYYIATALCTLGEMDDAIETVEKAIALGYPLYLVATDAGFSELQELPAFEAMMAQQQRALKEAVQGGLK